MELRELQLFLAVAEELNFRAAADRLHLSQPPLTRAIAKLERKLDVKLFERSTRRVELTPAGRALLPQAREILDRVEDMKLFVREIARLKRGTLRIGVTPAALHSTAIRSIWKFREERPGVTLEIVEGKVDEHLRRLHRGLLDAALLPAPAAPSGDFEQMILEQEALGVLVPVGHRLSTRRRLRLRDLDGETLLMHEPREIEGFHRAIVSLFSGAGVRVKFRYKKKGENCALLASMGEGLLLTFESLSKFAMPGVTYVPLAADLKASLAAYWNEANENLALRSFVDFLASQDSIRAPKSPCLMSLANW